MTREELRRERQMERIRSRVVRDELKRLKRSDEIRNRVEDAFSVMTAITLFALLIVAFIIDGVGAIEIPSWIYVAGFAYLGAYAIMAYYKFFK